VQQPPAVDGSACMRVGVEGPRGHHAAVVGHEARGTWSGVGLHVKQAQPARASRTSGCYTSHFFV
jgi:hypothetical protein